MSSGPISGLLRLARAADLAWTARLAALLLLDRIGVDGLEELQAQIADEYAAPPVKTAFRVVNARDASLLASCERAQALGVAPLASSTDARRPEGRADAP